MLYHWYCRYGFHERAIIFLAFALLFNQFNLATFPVVLFCFLHQSGLYTLYVFDLILYCYFSPYLLFYIISDKSIILLFMHGWEKMESRMEKLLIMKSPSIYANNALTCSKVYQPFLQTMDFLLFNFLWIIILLNYKLNQYAMHWVRESILNFFSSI